MAGVVGAVDGRGFGVRTAFGPGSVRALRIPHADAGTPEWLPTEGGFMKNIRRFEHPEIISVANPEPLPRPHYVGETIVIPSRKKSLPLEVDDECQEVVL